MPTRADQSTLDAPDVHRRRADRPILLGLVVLWWDGDLARAGQLIVAPDSGPAVLGRDPTGHAALRLHRPGRLDPAGPIDDRRLSRRQLELRTAGGAVLVRGIGRLPLRHRGHDRDEIALAPGDTCTVGEVACFMAVRREVELPDPGEALHPFGRPDADGLVGESPAAWSLRRRLAAVGPRRPHVLICGASGTGKERVARALHRRSPGGPFVARSAATIPESIADAELFGNLADYPNPGMPDRPGLVGAASGGTLFLDEIGELGSAAQARLLRVLDDGEYHRLGEAGVSRADFRLVAATNRGPTALKADLRARLPLRIEAPELAERREDIALIAAHLLRRNAEQDPALARFFPGGDPSTTPRLRPPLVRALATRAYPGNVRELEELLWRSALDSPGDTLEAAPEDDWGTAGAEPTPERIQAVLDAHNGVQEAAWRELGLGSRHQLARLIRRHGLVVRRRPG